MLASCSDMMAVGPSVSGIRLLMYEDVMCSSFKRQNGSRSVE